MIPLQKELFRKAILTVLGINRSRFGFGIVAIGHQLGSLGFSVSNFTSAKEFHDAIADEVDYLRTKNLVEETDKIISRENRAWRLTDAGIAFLDSNP